MLYTVLEILEDLDVGCEDRPDGEGPRAIAILEDEGGNQRSFSMADALFYERGIEEGVRVYIDEEDTLQKAIVSGDWTRDFSGMDIDVTDYVHKMELLREGKKGSWKCPFCGGNVILIKSEAGRTLIGCDSCDMRIENETHSRS